jgi:protein TonB
VVIPEVPIPPGALRNPPPPYPQAARRAGQEGTVRLRVEVSTLGRAAAVSVVTTSGHPLLDQAAATTVARWRFTPARLAGHPVPGTVEIPITFTLQQR